ncbi:FKBP-type peptidyl-prolyl cis-trans isomerase [Halopseudomonas phragmitis]|uniref:Peptidyl-prolyl cis-trans isomerase n=2 Tax=Pseudomonadaceae TaxID=135621 RepID=A0A1V0B4C6_9GAMM|nr:MULTISPECIES: FKBP-type peptidyl-prolyl cis-trans isomerase [Pseudomonadaceae]AQZ94783.1 peptidylprolyl isomerase [Halopseudomonas phragmitis]RHW22941.1 FKBP-type peptidyl-prolyl cis-trans isomerase [Pseudomonas jilinensis]
MTDIRITHDSQVTLHFTLKLPGGEVVDTTVGKKPATFKVGDGSLLPGFEQSLFGLKAGDQRSFEIEPERGFGQGNPQNVQSMPRDGFKDMEPEPGLMIIFQDAAGGEMPGVVKSVSDTVVEIDFNHPLAGKVVTFEVEILDVA